MANRGSNKWGPGSRVLWLALGASFFFLARAGEMFACGADRVHDVHCLRRGDVAFFHKETQLNFTGLFGVALTELTFDSGDRKVTSFVNGRLCHVHAKGNPVRCVTGRSR